MWNTDKSLTLSLVCTKIAIVLVFAAAIAFPIALRKGLFGEDGYVTAQMNDHIPLIIAIFIICCLLALIALFSLNRLLANIKNGNVFTEKNVRLLRTISWMCFAVAIATLVAGFATSFFFLVIGALACFFGLILRVVKNVIAAAVQLKDENDYTI
ncbi:MAG: DUF2975 domain-containing protein [Clostridiales Family XIII bacterium]|nr:DUF2975 domain-containing protein [Clostridiales Family XIII bacterium]